MSPRPPRVLIVDDEPNQREILSDILKAEGFEPREAANVEGGYEAFGAFRPEAVICDLKLGAESGIGLMERIVAEDDAVAVVILTAFGTISSAVKAIKRGAFDYIAKPVDREKILIVTRRGVERTRLLRENRMLRDRLGRWDAFSEFVGKHPSVGAVVDLVNRVAPLEETVLISGETGTGKELVARQIHTSSPRCAGPFVPINCSSIPEFLFESELFGFVKGSFTGAATTRQGIIEVASGGSIFFDEIGDLPVSMQAKLLRFLEDKSIRPVGGKQEVVVDVRVISATNKDLAQEVKEKRFRGDLYYRLNVLSIHLPALRNRSNDIPLLLDHFLKMFSSEYKKEVSHVSDRAMKVLMEYPWPGNVRQLKYVIQKAVILCDSQRIEIGHLPSEVLSSALACYGFEIPDQKFSLEEFEKNLLLQAMERSGGVMAKAAELLGLTYRTLQYRLEKYGIKNSKE
jgi:DNA-binding NtrC family response regulator